MTRLRFRVDEESLTASGERGERARLGLLWLQASADPVLRARLRQQRVRAAPNGLPGSVHHQLFKLALRAGLAAATTPVAMVEITAAALAPPVGIEALTDALARARRAADDHRRPYEEAVRDVLARAGREAAAAILAHVTDHLPAAGDEEAPAHPGWTPPSADEVLAAETLRESLRTATDPIRKKAVERWIGAFSRDMPGISFKLKSPFFGAVIEGSAQHIADVTETTRRELISFLARAFKDGLSVTATSELIRSAMTSDASTRARTIARTELQRIANGAAVAGVRIVSGATGERFLKRWLAAPGADSPRHELVPDLETRGLDEPFDVNGYPADYPGDPNLPPEESIGCRCVVVFRQVDEG
jgi:hypothetical protein